MRINTNVASLNAQESATNTNKLLTSSLEKLGSGLRINKAGDDASGLAIADKLRTQASSMGQGISNGNSASALIQIADKAMSEQSNILDTVKTKLIQAGTSTTSADGREAIRKDVSKLLEQFDNIAAQTNYNGTTLLQQSSTDTAKADTFSFQLGEDSTFDVEMSQGIASNTDKLGGGDSNFGAASINSSVNDAAILAANTIGATGATLYGNTTAGDNNIDAFSAQEISSSGAVVLDSASFDSATGVEAAGGQSLDITVSGDIGKLTFAGAVKLDISSETEEVQDAVRALASADDIDSDGNVSMAAGNLDFSNIEFSALRIDTQSSDTVTLNTGNSSEARTFTIENNYGQNQLDLGKNRGDVGVLPKDGQINVLNTSGASLTGGAMLSNLKELQEDELTADVANQFMEVIDKSLTQLNSVRSDFGSTQNQIESSIRNMQTTQTNLKAAESVIRDVDYAAESAAFNKQNIVAQAGTYAMSQANSMAQNVQKLLQ